MIERTAAIVAYLFLAAGLSQRKNRRLHPALMSCAILIDAILVITLQVQRHVIQEAATQSFTLFQAGHILSSTVAFALYFPVVIMGVLLLRGKGGPALRTWHIRCALTAFAFRTAGLILMFSL